MSYSAYYNGYSRPKICLSNNNGIESIRLNKNSYDLITELNFTKEVSPTLYPDGYRHTLKGIPTDPMYWENPILSYPIFTDKSI
jgi:hypothetical protein